ncbi:MAG: Cys-tRNA(Pro) deacylase [Deltaproteobacteria bacterium]|nr:Cys-tRNA(Pro) deacylase [Deltaproteobacteria bacterium]
MAADRKTPATSAVRALRRAGVDFEARQYRYEDHGGTQAAASELNLDHQAVIKTLVMEDDKGRPLIVLMHGDREVSTKALARILEVKTVSPCSPRTAARLTGYQVGGTSPFGLRQDLPIYVEESILSLDKIAINGGKRGLLVEISPDDLVRLLEPIPVRAAR